MRQSLRIHRRPHRGAGMVALALVATAALLLVPTSDAEACSCALPEGITYPSDGDIDVPINTRILGVTGNGMPPTVSVYYDNDPTRIVPGTLETLGALGAVEVWAFVPDEELDASRLVNVESSVWGTPLSLTFTTGLGADNEGPEYDGVTAAYATEVWFITVDGFDMCTTPPTAGDTAGALTWDADSPMDNVTPYTALLRHVYLYDTPGATPTVPTVTTTSWWAFEGTSCWQSGPCTPTVDLDFVAGDTVCMRIEIEDAAGNLSGYDSEACSNVELRSVDYADGFCTDTPWEGFSDGGVPPIPGTDGGVPPNPGTDSGTMPPGGEGPGGCACRVGSTPKRTPVVESVTLLALLGLVLAMRRRHR